MIYYFDLFAVKAFKKEADLFARNRRGRDRHIPEQFLMSYTVPKYPIVPLLQ